MYVHRNRVAIGSNSNDLLSNLRATDCKVITKIPCILNGYAYTQCTTDKYSLERNQRIDSKLGRQRGKRRGRERGKGRKIGRGRERGWGWDKVDDDKIAWGERRWGCLAVCSRYSTIWETPSREVNNMLRYQISKRWNCGYWKARLFCLSRLPSITSFFNFTFTPTCNIQHIILRTLLNRQEFTCHSQLCRHLFDSCCVYLIRCCFIMYV